MTLTFELFWLGLGAMLGGAVVWLVVLLGRWR
jgi:hypothetical protein